MYYTQKCRLTVVFLDSKKKKKMYIYIYIYYAMIDVSTIQVSLAS